MRNTFSVIALIFCGLWSASQASAGTSYCTGISDNIVSNCGFETGDFTNWTISGDTANPGDYYYGVDGFDANSGNYGAYMSQDGVSSSVDLSQTLTTIMGDMYTFSFFLEQDTAPQTGYTHAFTATWGGTTVLSLTPTVALPGPVEVWTQYTFTEMATSTSTIINFAFENDDSYWSFDDVVVDLNAIPEPSTGLLAGAALCALLLLRLKLPARKS